MKLSVPVGQANRGGVFGDGVIANLKTWAPTGQAGRGPLTEVRLSVATWQSQSAPCRLARLEPAFFD